MSNTEEVSRTNGVSLPPTNGVSLPPTNGVSHATGVSRTNVLTEFIHKNKHLLIAEGYLFEFMRRGRVKTGSLVPEVIIDSPECLRMLQQEFVDAGSDVVQAFTYYIHRTKLRDVGREHDLELINRTALRIAREVARENNKLFAGGLCNTNYWDPSKPETIAVCRQMFKEQTQWAVNEGVDFMIAETFWDYGEASLALEVIKETAPDLPTVITICPVGIEGKTFDGVDLIEALRRLQEEGADVVGFNCQRGPASMLPLIKEAREKLSGPLACNPVGFRTDNEKWPTFTRFKYPGTEETCYPHDVHIYTCSLREIAQFAMECRKIGISYVGLCCGNNPSMMKALTEGFNRKSLLSKYGLDRHNNSLARKASSDQVLSNTQHKEAQVKEPSRYDNITEFCGITG